MAVPDDPDTDIFDKPFEPRLESMGAADSATAEAESDGDDEEEAEGEGEGDGDGDGEKVGASPAKGNLTKKEEVAVASTIGSTGS